MKKERETEEINVKKIEGERRHERERERRDKEGRKNSKMK